LVEIAGFRTVINRSSQDFPAFACPFAEGIMATEIRAAIINRKLPKKIFIFIFSSMN